MRFKVSFCLIVMSFVISTNIMGQVSNNITKEDITQELAKRNIKLEDLESALLEKGIDLNSINPEALTLEEQQTIRSVISDLSNKKDKAVVKGEVAKVDSVEEKKKVKVDTAKVEKGKEVNKEKEKEIIWGQSLFKNKGILIEANNAILKAPDSYVLGPGDELIISVWGKSQFENNHVIDEKGYIRLIDNRVRVFLKGITLGNARSKIKRILLSEYSFGEGEYDIAINYSRTLRISIYGEVMGNPGSYAISGFNSAFNALSAVNGPNEFGSLRNIKLQKAGGQTMTLDVYEFMLDPSVQSKFFLDDSDVIIVPVQGNVVTIRGAVKRPLKYELLDDEGLNDLIEFAGGFTEDAYKQKLQVKRYLNDEQSVIDLNWNDLQAGNENFRLLDGDVVIIEEVEKKARNFVEVIGEVDKPSLYERLEGMKLSDLVGKVGLNENTNREILYLTRTNADGTKSLLKINLNQVLNDISSDQNITLQDLDKIEFWPKSRFADKAIITVKGAVRVEGEYPYDQGGDFRVVDAILMSGGLRRDASSYAIIHKNDPLNPNKKYYKTIDNLSDLMANPDLETNYVLSPFDILVVESKNEFEEELFVRIEGAVNRPGKYQYGEDMTIKDLLVLAKGFKMAASTNNIEVSRVVRRNNEPTSIVVALLEIDEDFNVLTKGVSQGEFILEPFDNVAVRFIKDFELQKRVFLTGEIEVPGPYAIFKENLKISTVIERAGGITKEAYPSGATLYREEENIGKIVIKLEEILSDETSEFNFVVKNGDVIHIPTVKEFVTIRGATRVEEVLGRGAISENNEIKVPYQEGKDAMFYINEHAGGLSDEADRSKIFVEHANGEIKKPKWGFFKKRYPEVLQGSIVTVGEKSEELKNEEEKEKVDWTKVLGDSVGQAMSILTLILLIQRLE